MNPHRLMDRQVQWLPPDCMLAQSRAGSGISPAGSAFPAGRRLQGLRGERRQLLHKAYT